MKNFLMAIGALLTACSTNTLQPAQPEITLLPPSIGLTSQPNQIGFQVQVSRNGYQGSVLIEVTNLPNGMNANPTTLEPNQNQGTIMLTGHPTTPGPQKNATMHLHFGAIELTRPLALDGLLSTPEATSSAAGNHDQTVRNIDSNATQYGFQTPVIYANFKGSACQVMIQEPNAGLYICFNQTIHAGDTYSLTQDRGPEAPSNTASVTYYQNPASIGSQAFWDSDSGTLQVETSSSQGLIFHIRRAHFVPAKGFEHNAATGSFELDASTNVTTLSNLP